MRHVYVHVPFCARRCSYCDFAIAVRKTIPADRYVAAIRREIDLRREQGEWDHDPVETLYFGGGTPSLLPARSIAELVGLVAPNGLAPGESGDGAIPEVTLEANPDDVTPAAVEGWVGAGVNRLSLGAQSFSPAALRWMHRTHDADAVPRAVATARGGGITSLSLDLIFGLPEDAGASFQQDLGVVISLAPEHVSVYGLSVEERTPLARWISRGATLPPSDDRYAEEFLLAHRVLTAEGYEHYEVSNYARPGHRARHNGMYWIGRPYVGLGPAAHSHRPGERRWNLRDWTAYERAVLSGGDPTEQRERLTAEQERLERFYLGFRTDAGLEASDLRDVDTVQQERWTARGWLRRDSDTYRLSPEGWLYLDEIVSGLTTSGDGG